jgi:DtxR family transcriptional regulator, Mn-dependent transcriptional regulator
MERGREDPLFGTAVEDYLKTIFKLSQRHDRVSPSAVAETAGVTAAAVTKMVKRLVDLHLVTYERAAGIELTDSGRKVALEMIRHHRLIELYLKEALGYPWDALHEEAEKLEHHISEEFEDRIDAMLGHPTHDPHGAPIPTKDGHLETPDHAVIADLRPGQAAKVARVPDEDPAMLRYLGELGLYPGTPIELLKREPFEGPLTLVVEGTERIVGVEVARRVWIEAG